MCKNSPAGLACWAFVVYASDMNKLSVIAAVAIAASSCASAQSCQNGSYIVAQVGSHHPNDASMRSDTRGTGLEVGNCRLRVVGGRFNNSEGGKSSYIAVASTPYKLYGGVRGGGMVGMIDGYKRNNGGILPIAAGVATYERGRYGANVVVTPPVAGATMSITLQLKARID